MILLLFADENKIDTFYKPFKIESMEVVTIEKRTFSYVCERFTEFAKRIESLCSTHTQKVENWLDSQEVLGHLGLGRFFLKSQCAGLTEIPILLYFFFPFLQILTISGDSPFFKTFDL